MGWRAQLAILGMGAKGIDLMSWIRWGSTRKGWIQGFFYGAKLETRQTDVESSYGVAAEIGFKL